MTRAKRVAIPILFLLVVSVGGVVRTVNAQPIIQTDAATGVTDTSAVLNGVVTPNGQDTVWYFLYGSSSSPGPNNCPTTSFSTMPAGSPATPVTCTLNGLQPSTTYTFSLKGVWMQKNENTLGALLSFTTSPSTTTPATDWAVLSVSLSPSAPNVGDPVTFSMVMTAVSSPGPFPQNFAAVCAVDGVSCGSGSFTYPGPVGTPFTVSTQTPWVATVGAHKLSWGVATVPVGLDPNKGNNVMSKSFMVAPQGQFDFSMSASPTQQSVVPGGSTSYAVTVNLVSGTTQSVALSLSTPPPAGVSVTFAPTSGTPPFSSTLSVSTTSSASPGTFTLTISGVGGGASHSVPVTLIVSQAPDFQISVSPTSQSVLQGQPVSYSVNVVALNGFNSEVDLAVSGLPAGANGVFSASSGTPNYASTLTVTLPANGSTGPFTLTITGNGVGQSRAANVILIINQLPQTSTQTVNTQTSSPPAGDLMGLLQQNGSLILAAVIIIALLALAASRRRKPSGPAPVPQGPRAGTVYCSKCGALNPVTNEFCGKCGRKIND